MKRKIISIFVTMSLLVCSVLAINANPTISVMAKEKSFETTPVKENQVVGTVIKTGSCGENLTYTITINGTDEIGQETYSLTIEGYGDMEDEIPWQEYSSYLTELNLSDDITSIGYGAFRDCGFLTVIIPNSITRIPDYAFAGCSSLTDLTIPNSVTGIGWGAFEGCSSLTSLEIPSSVTGIGWSAFEGCSSLTSLEIPSSVISIGRRAFAYCKNIKNIYFKGDIPYVSHDSSNGDVFVGITANAYFPADNNTWINELNEYYKHYEFGGNITWASELDFAIKEFIETHLNYIGNNANNTYHYLLNYCDLSKIALRDYSELKDTYDKRRLLRGSIFNNPYEVALAELIISEESADGQMDSFTVNLYSKQRSIINNVMKLINGKVSLTSDQKSKMEKLFSERTFDDATYQLCADILGKYVSEDELKTLFQTYDTSNKFMGLFGDGKKIVDSVVDVINYSSILQAYNETTDEFKEALTLVDYYCQGENSELDYAITQYLLVTDKTDINNQIIKKVVGNSIDVGKDLFEETILSKVRNFMIENMDLSNVAEATATKLLAVIEGMKIGYSLGTTIDNVLFNTDNVTDAYITAYASCKLAYYMKFALDDYATNLKKNQTIENAELFCETYNMYKHTQINVAENMIRYFASNEQSLINKIFKSSAYEAAIYQWQILKLNWDNAKCHDESVTYTNTKNLTIACPVDIEIKDDSDNLILKVVNNAVTYNSGKAIATIRNNIKYITIPDDSYSVNIMATDTGKMNYCITNFSYLEPTETVNFENIQLEKNNTYIGAITEGENLSVQENALASNGKTVESTSSVFKKNEKIDVSEIKFPKEDIELTVGSTEKLQAEILPVTASVKTVTWFSSNPEIATVDEYGTIAALAKGNVTVYCSTLDGKVTSECKITVKALENNSNDNTNDTDVNNNDTNVGNQGSGNDIDTNTGRESDIKVSKIALTGISKKIAAGKKIKLTAKVFPANASNRSVTWKSSNTKVATVNNAGVVKVKKGSGGKKVTITAMAMDGSGVKSTYRITSMKGVVKKIVVSGKKSVKAGKSLKLKVKVTASKKANKKLKWISSNTKYATVNSSGKVKTKKIAKGKKVKITAFATDGSGKKKTITIKIR